MKLRSTEDTINQAKSMAEDFAKIRGRELLKRFLTESNLGAELYQAYRDSQPSTPLEASDFGTCLLNDYDAAFGQSIATGYAMGFIDACENIRSDLYRKSLKKEEPQQGEKPAQLILPGLD